MPKFGNKTSCKGEAKTENKIDYIFVSPNVSVKKCAVIANNVDGTFASDHLPIIAVVEVKIRFETSWFLGGTLHGHRICGVVCLKQRNGRKMICGDGG
ncbi:MAG: hypothetical protein ACLUKN_06820 [Bacilli bacterium]